MRIPSIVGKVRRVGFFELLSVGYLTKFLAFGTTLLVAKFLSPAELGNVKVLQSYISVFTIFAIFGLNTAVLKSCAELQENEEKEKVLRLAVGRAVLAAALSLVVIVALCFSGVLTSSTHLSFWLVILAISIPFSTLTTILISYLQALKRFKSMARAQFVVKIQSVVIIIFATWFWGFRGFIIATVIGFAMGLVPLVWQVGSRFLRTGPAAPPAGFNHISLHSMLSNGVKTVAMYADLFLLDHLVTDRAMIGCYSFAVVLTMAAAQVTTTVQSIATPYFVEHSRDKEWFLGRLRYYQRRTTLLSFGVALAVYAGGWLIVLGFLGEEYRPMLVFLPVLLLRYIFWSANSIRTVAMLGIGYIRYNTITACVRVVVATAGGYLLLTQFDIIGVAWAQALSSAAALVLLWLLSKKALHKAFASEGPSSPSS